MECPKCHKPTRIVHKEMTHNLKKGEDYKTYDKLTYLCEDDDIWVVVETPTSTKGAIHEDK